MRKTLWWQRKIQSKSLIPSTSMRTYAKITVCPLELTDVMRQSLKR